MDGYSVDYSYVANKRALKNYTDDDCYQCPGLKQCLAIYDHACAWPSALQTKFPCGKHLDTEGLV